MQGLKLIWNEVANQNEIGEVAARVVKELESVSASGPFCLWLIGGLGAGKTTFTGELLRAMGLPREIPVTSPTYTYMNEYRIGKGLGEKWYAHLDLYRAGSRLDPSELGVFDARPFRGYIVEWPEMLHDPESLAPSHVLSIEVADGGQRRTYRLERRSAT